MKEQVLSNYSLVKLEDKNLKEELIKVLNWEYNYWKNYYIKKLEKIIMDKELTKEKKRKK